MKRLMMLVFVGAVTTPLFALLQNTLKVDVSLVNVPFLVTDAQGRFMPGLSKEDFAVEEDGRKQDIQSFSRENSLPLSIGMLIDTSPSVSRVFDDEKETATNFLDTTLRRGDSAFVIGFSREVTLVEDFTDNRQKLRDAIQSLFTQAGTSVYDAIYLACNEVFKSEGGRKTIILISDGEDTTSKVRLSEAMTVAEKSEAVIYSISNRVGGFFNVRGTGNPEALRRLSAESGGTVYFVAGRSDLTEVFDEISEELRSQYSLGYVSTNTVKDGKYRSIRIIPKNAAYKARGRSGYYAPLGPS